MEVTRDRDHSLALLKRLSIHLTVIHHHQRLQHGREVITIQRVED